MKNKCLELIVEGLGLSRINDWKNQIYQSVVSVERPVMSKN